MAASVAASRLLNDAPVIKRKTRRRLLDRIHRISSSPQLVELGTEQSYSSRNSVSCISLVTGSSKSKDSHDDRYAIRIVEREINAKPVKVAEIPASTTLKAVIAVTTPTMHKVISKNFLETLPGELCLRVLSYLEPKELVRCSRVNKALRKLCFDGQLWKILDTTTFYKEIPVEQLTKLISVSGSFVRYLNLRGCVQLQNEFHAITSTCKNLVVASLEGCSLGRPTVHRLITSNAFLMHLNVSGLDSVSNLTCKNIAESCRYLETLDISYCMNMDARGIRRIVESCLSLTSLRAAECGGINDSVTLEAIFKSNNLEKLDLSGCSSLTDESVRILVEGAEADIDPLTGRTTAPTRKLKYLSLGRCKDLTDVALKHLAYNVPNIEGLELAHVTNLTDEGLSELLPTVPRLSHLDLEECSSITNDLMLELVKAPCAKTMKHLQLSFCENIADEGMVEVVKQCTSLRNLELDNTRITDNFLTEAAEAVRRRIIDGKSLEKPTIGLRLVCFDCVSINWTGIHSVLGANSSQDNDLKTNLPPSKEVVQLKCYYGWQQTVDQHLKLVLQGDVPRAKWLEDRWADHMTSNEDSTLGSRRRRRRAREAAMLDIDDNGNEGRRRRRGGGCTIM